MTEIPKPKLSRELKIVALDDANRCVLEEQYIDKISNFLFCLPLCKIVANYCQEPLYAIWFIRYKKWNGSGIETFVGISQDVDDLHRKMNRRLVYEPFRRCSWSCLSDEILYGYGNATSQEQVCLQCALAPSFCVCLGFAARGCARCLVAKIGKTFYYKDEVDWTTTVLGDPKSFKESMAKRIIDIAGQCKGYAFGGYVRDRVVLKRPFRDLDLCFPTKKNLDKFFELVLFDDEITAVNLSKGGAYKEFFSQRVRISFKFLYYYLYVDVIVSKQLLPTELAINSLTYNSKGKLGAFKGITITDVLRDAENGILRATPSLLKCLHEWKNDNTIRIKLERARRLLNDLMDYKRDALDERRWCFGYSELDSVMFNFTRQYFTGDGDWLAYSPK